MEQGRRLDRPSVRARSRLVRVALSPVRDMEGINHKINSMDVLHPFHGLRRRGNFIPRSRASAAARGNGKVVRVRGMFLRCAASNLLGFQGGSVGEQINIIEPSEALRPHFGGLVGRV